MRDRGNSPAVRPSASRSDPSGPFSPAPSTSSCSVDRVIRRRPTTLVFLDGRGNYTRGIPAVYVVRRGLVFFLGDQFIFHFPSLWHARWGAPPHLTGSALSQSILSSKRQPDGRRPVPGLAPRRTAERFRTSRPPWGEFGPL